MFNDTDKLPCSSFSESLELWRWRQQVRPKRWFPSCQITRYPRRRSQYEFRAFSLSSNGGENVASVNERRTFERTRNAWFVFVCVRACRTANELFSSDLSERTKWVYLGGQCPGNNVTTSAVCVGSLPCMCVWWVACWVGADLCKWIITCLTHDRSRVNTWFK